MTAWGAHAGLLLMFALGLRHGLDPDHIACIDSLTWRSIENGAGMARWVGALFALGHGMVVTAVAILLGQLAGSFTVPPHIAVIFEWLPTILLVAVGWLNLRELLSPGRHYVARGWVSRLMPVRLRARCGPLGVVLVGMLFAVVFDTATQASMWAYATTVQGGSMAAMVAGLAFTLGMAMTDTIDARLLCGAARRSGGGVESQRNRRWLGILIVCLSFGTALYRMITALEPEAAFDDLRYSLLGLCLFLLMVAAWTRSVILHRKTQAAAVPSSASSPSPSRSSAPASPSSLSSPSSLPSLPLLPLLPSLPSLTSPTSPTASFHRFHRLHRLRRPHRRPYRQHLG